MDFRLWLHDNLFCYAYMASVFFILNYIKGLSEKVIKANCELFLYLIVYFYILVIVLPCLYCLNMGKYVNTCMKVLFVLNK